MNAADVRIEPIGIRYEIVCRLPDGTQFTCPSIPRGLSALSWPANLIRRRKAEPSCSSMTVLSFFSSGGITRLSVIALSKNPVEVFQGNACSNRSQGFNHEKSRCENRVKRLRALLTAVFAAGRDTRR
jgi:hypothetical protein